MQRFTIMMRFNLLTAFLLLAFSTYSQVDKRTYLADDDLVPVAHTVDMLHLKLKASFEPEKKLIKGEVEQTFVVLRKELDSLVLNAIRMRVEEISLNGSAVKYRNTARELIIYFEKTLAWSSQHKLRIKYEANPKKGLYFIGWNDPLGKSRKQIWTQGQGIDNRHWIPMYDEKNDKLTTEMIIEFDEGYEVLSNGKKLKEKKIADGKKLWHYRISHPHPTYLIMLGIGKYAIDERKTESGVPMKLYYYPDQEEQLEPTYRYSVAMFDYFEKEIGVPYPWETYAQIPVQDFMYGAMENTTATLFGDFYLVDSRGYLDRNYVRVNAHELAHQWFGDMVTARSSAHHWLQESFATHYDLVYQGEAFGQDHFDWTRRNYNLQALEASKTDLKPIAHSKAGTVRHYPKGAFVLEMLKYVVGREQFNAAIQYYLQKHAYGNVDSEDLLIAFHEKLGLSLDWFWEDWVYRGGEPEYEVHFNQLADKATFKVKQVHEQNDLVDLFKMPIVFQLHFKDGSMQEKQLIIDQQAQEVSFTIPNGKEVSFPLFDPNNQILKKVTFPKSTEMLKAQAENAPFMLDRYDAIVALIQAEFANKEDFLMKRFQEESFHAIKAEIVNYLVPQLNENSARLARRVIEKGDTEVKKALLASTLRVPEELESDYRKLLQDSSYQVVEQALNLLCFYYPKNAENYLTACEVVIGDRSHNVRIEWLKQAYLHRGKIEYVQELGDLCGESYEFLTRTKAAEALKELNYLDPKALANMLNATFSFNRRLVGPVRAVIDHFFEQAAYKQMIVNYVSIKEWEDDEFKKVSPYLKP
jgi:aminopeptidase N